MKRSKPRNAETTRTIAVAIVLSTLILSSPASRAEVKHAAPDGFTVEPENHLFEVQFTLIF